MKADVELGMLNRGKRISEPTGVSSTGLPIGKAVRRPMRIHFEPPADPTSWRLTGRVNWHSQHQDYGIVPTCEWANHEGLRIWLPARHKDFVAEFNYGAGWPLERADFMQPPTLNGHPLAVSHFYLLHRSWLPAIGR